MPDALLDMVRHYSTIVRNDRTLRSIHNHASGEMVELDQEITAVESSNPAGEDGIVGEAVDVLQCMLDLIFKSRPDITNEEILTIMHRKCVKWREKYSEEPAPLHHVGHERGSWTTACPDCLEEGRRLLREGRLS